MCKVNSIEMSAWTARVSECFEYYQRPFRYLGLFPFIESNGTTKISRLALVWSIFIGLTVSTFALTYLFLSQREKDLPKILIIIDKILSITTATSHILFVTFLVTYRQTLVSAFQILRRLERKLSGLNPHASFTYPALSMSALILILILSLFVSPNKNRLMDDAIFLIPTFFIYGTAYLYTRTLILVKHFFTHITNSLYIKKDVNNLDILLDCNDLLINCCDDLNKCFGPSLLSIMTTSFCMLTFNFYMLFSSKIVDLYAKLVAAVWIIIYTNLVLHVVWASNSTVKEADSFKNTINRFAFEGNNEQIKKAMILLSSDKTVIFSACDLFDMDFKMVCSVSTFKYYAYI
ncbi:hypothetical protein O3M35_012032 [Rhynocoris fuscipes]|uniref:Gustatory receptor n=1 Tax=Rhynocoris fuscipes TaxID=488301 RepID=A0AAW1CQX6_9HEMI